MRSRRAFWISAIALMTISGTAWAWMLDAQRARPFVKLRLDRDVRPGVHATGFVGLSDSLQTVAAPNKRVRVLAYDIRISSGGTEVVSAFGMPSVETEGTQAEENRGGTKLGPNPAPGEEKFPRKFGIVIRPKGSRTWGAVANEDDLEILIEWEPQQ